METLNGFISLVKPIIELIYFISAIGLALFAYLGLQQIAILKSTSATQAKRDALKLTSEQCTIYVEKIIPLQNAYHAALKKHNIKYFDGWTTEVLNDEIIVSRKTPPDPKGFEEAIPHMAFLNNMEAFSVYFTSGVADEEVAYNSVAKTFLKTCDGIMPWAIKLRKDGYFKSLVSLYIIWKSRAENEKLIIEKENIEKKLTNTKTTFRSPIGT